MVRAVVDRLLEPVLRDVRQGRADRDALGSLLREVESVEDLFDGVGIRNRFVWPNGERRFRIDSVIVDDGVLRLRLEPLLR